MSRVGTLRHHVFNLRVYGNISTFGGRKKQWTNGVIWTHSMLGTLCTMFSLLKLIRMTRTGCLRKVRRIYNLYISGCIGARVSNRVPNESLFKVFCLSEDPPHRVI